MKQFQNELTKLINRHSLENESNTPDYILSDYLVRCLKNFNEASTHRVDWYGVIPREALNPDLRDTLDKIDAKFDKPSKTVEELTGVIEEPHTTTDCNYTVGIDGPGEELKQ